MMVEILADLRIDRRLAAPGGGPATILILGIVIRLRRGLSLPACRREDPSGASGLASLAPRRMMWIHDLWFIEGCWD